MTDIAWLLREKRHHSPGTCRGESKVAVFVKKHIQLGASQLNRTGLYELVAIRRMISPCVLGNAELATFHKTLQSDIGELTKILPHSQEQDIRQKNLPFRACLIMPCNTQNLQNGMLQFK